LATRKPQGGGEVGDTKFHSYPIFPPYLPHNQPDVSWKN